MEWSNDGGRTWTPATFVTGSVTAASTSQIRWTSTVTVLDVPYGLHGINPYQTRYRIRQGMIFSDHEQPEWVGLGHYRLMTVTHSSQDPDTLVLTGESYESYLIQAIFTKPRTIFPTAAIDVCETLIREVLPSAKINWADDIDAYLLLPKLVSVTDRWATIDGPRDATSVAKALGARIYPDGNGVWMVEPVPSLQDAPSWTAREGPGGVSLGVTEALTNQGVTNVEIVTGTPTDLPAIGPAIAMDSDSLSLTWVGKSPDFGGYGEVPAAEYQSQMITSLDQANKVARTRLAARLGLKQQLSFGVLHDPTKTPGQVGLVYGLEYPMRVILDSVTYDLSAAPGPLSCQTRTTQTRLAGDVTELLDDEA